MALALGPDFLSLVAVEKRNKKYYKHFLHNEDLCMYVCIYVCLKIYMPTT